MEDMGVEDMIDTSFWKGKKVFLTGHTGFKGSWLSIWLNELGAEVCGYALAPNTTPSLYQLVELDKHIISFIGDIRDLPHLQKTMQEFKPDIVIHMAAQPLVRESYDNPVDTYSTNVMGTVNILESVRYCPTVKAVVNVTTDKVYENQEWIWGYRETDRLGGYDPYSNSKACSELVTSSYVNSFFNPEKYVEHGVAIAIARAGNVIGGGDWAKDRLVPDALKAIQTKKDIEIRNPFAIRPWQHVLEPLSGYLMLAENLYVKGPKYNGAWNFGPDADGEKNVEWVVNKVLETYQSESVCKSVESEKNVHEATFLKLDCSKSKFHLGWYPKWNLEEAISKIIEWQKHYELQKDMRLFCAEQIEAYMKE